MTIKLFQIEVLKDGTKRLQSQMLAGTDTANFIMRTDGVMLFYAKGNDGFGFYPYDKPYVIVGYIKDLKNQVL
jgi:hypothetical protein